MNNIISKDKVRQAVERALLLAPNSDMDAAINAAAQVLGLDVETVREVVTEVAA